MHWGWINWINTVVISYFVLINIIAAGKNVSGSFRSKHPAVNLFEQLGRYGCIFLMVLPVFTRGWKFGFASVAELFIWLFITILLPVLYTLLWFKKRNHGAGVLYGLAIVPSVLFLLNGILLRHPALVTASVVFGVFHVWIIQENISHGSGN